MVDGGFSFFGRMSPNSPPVGVIGVSRRMAQEDEKIALARLGLSSCEAHAYMIDNKSSLDFVEIGIQKLHRKRRLVYWGIYTGEVPPLPVAPRLKESSIQT